MGSFPKGFVFARSVPLVIANSPFKEAITERIVTEGAAYGQLATIGSTILHIWMDASGWHARLHINVEEKNAVIKQGGVFEYHVWAMEISKDWRDISIKLDRPHRYQWE